MRVDTNSPLVLADGDIDAWRRLLAADPALASPYLTPDWARLVARHRADVRVAIWRGADGAAMGFLAVQGMDPHAAMPVGGPVCDYQGVAGPAGLDVSLATKTLGVGRIDLTAGLKDNAVGGCLLLAGAGVLFYLLGRFGHPHVVELSSILWPVGIGLFSVGVGWIAQRPHVRNQAVAASPVVEQPDRKSVV